MKIEELGRVNRYWVFILVGILISCVISIFVYKHYTYDRPILIEQNNEIERLNHGYEMVREDETFADKTKTFEHTVTDKWSYSIGNEDPQPLLEIGSVSGNNYSDVHYFKIKTNRKQALRLVRRISDDHVLFSRWIDNEELGIWEQFDQRQEQLAKSPQISQLNSDIIKMKEKYPQLTN